ncbi:phosphonate C-P lyase system protein PhnG [Epibacterium ulvae]|uniref:phosphonate C-P lyase system protein PhnG n=1 Tax=Epibacterium ulvae TaxID=1156985 RepID=UPI0024925D28|nr:phosphonate C-P lyase system protein PhnG [Epibacterium ulvae]
MMTASDQTPRQAWLSVLATADAAQLQGLWRESGFTPEFDWLRAPEVGAVMTRARMGGTGAPFNLGEMTVTRCALTLSDGTVGHGYVQGRDKVKAETVALIDALMQGPRAHILDEVILVPLRKARHARKRARAEKAAATKVDFFTLVRGED